jgi:dCTP deaminase
VDHQVKSGKISYGLSSYGYDLRLGYRFKVFTNAHCTVVDPKGFDARSFVDMDLTPRDQTWHMDDNFQWTCLICGHTGRRITHTNKKWLEATGGAPQCPNDPKPKSIPPDHILIPPNSFALGESIEVFDMPRDLLAIVLGKSSYARCGIVVNCTPVEPEWCGRLTIEISNTTPLPAKVYAGEGIAQVLFLRSDEYTDELTSRLLYGVGCLKKGDPPIGCETSYADRKGKYQAQSGVTLPFVRGDEG